jgi:DNA polymerase I-like protein with 3'-5' exonuclease and polymerase domains
MPEARIFINTVYQVIKLRGFVKNFYGRRRRLDSDDCYKAPNALIQGCAADYIKYKVVDIYKYLMYNNLKTHLINIVHDELVIEFNNDELDHVPVLRWMLSEFKEFRCPITAGVEKGEPSWGQKVEPENVGFVEPEDKSYKNYNVYDGSVFNIYREVQYV